MIPFVFSSLTCSLPGAPSLVSKGGSFFTLLRALCPSAHLCDNLFPTEAFPV
jgi:hypothetical protein